MKMPFTLPAALAACLLSACVCVWRGVPVLAEEYSDSIRRLGEKDTKADEQSSFAERFLKKDAEAGHAEAQFELGLMYHEGHGLQQNCAEARRWYEKAAAQGHAEAQRGLGELFVAGRGVPQDKSVAKEWFRKACSGDSQHACDSNRQLNDAGF